MHCFTSETWFCIPSLLLAHVIAIELYYIERGEKINPWSLNTDVVEWYFGDGRQMVGGSTNNITARQQDHAGFNANACNTGKHNVVGNNKTGQDLFGRQKRF